jgi:hypothetical protein
MLAVASLVLSLVSLIGYSRVIEQISGIVFVVATAFAFALGVVSLALGIVARRQSRRMNSILATMSIVVALGYLAALGVVLLNITVNWIIR